MFNIFDLDNDNDHKYLLGEIGQDITINDYGTQEEENGEGSLKAIITNAKSLDATGKNDRYITTLFEIKQGDFIKWNDMYWLIISPVNKQRYDKYKGVMRAITHIIGMAVQNGEAEIIGIPVVSYLKTASIIKGSYLEELEERIVLTTQDNDITRKIRTGANFVFNDSKYRIENKDFTELGLVHFYCSFEQMGVDDVEYIGDIPWQPVGENGNDGVIEYSITGNDSIYVEQSLIYTAVKKVNGVVDENAKFNFSIDYMGNDSSVALLEIISNTECEISAFEAWVNITLVAEDDENKEIVTKEIELMSFF